MGQAKQRGTYEERKTVAIARNAHIEAEAARLFKEWKATQEAKKVTPVGDTLVIGAN